MNYRRLFVLVEGEDDERFFESVARPVFENLYDFVQLWQYSQRKKAKVNSFLNSIRPMQASGEADLVIVADLDESPCVTDRKERIQNSYRSLSAGTGSLTRFRSSTRVLIVRREIESWYLAGLNDEECKRIGILSPISNTDHVAKEQFLSLMPNKFAAKAEFMLEILKVFDHETARTKNESFNYFMQNFGIVMR
ncbi:MAG: hypothetical protein OXI80_04030 [Caldilineaceae bacterium]|nr:hypothetical protein [Caldilineaceae bacterium]MDE0336817.1 hypothetical protein [Caldilineaceae bacterium]